MSLVSLSGVRILRVQISRVEVGHAARLVVGVQEVDVSARGVENANVGAATTTHAANAKQSKTV